MLKQRLPQTKLDQVQRQTCRTCERDANLQGATILEACKYLAVDRFKIDHTCLPSRLSPPGDVLLASPGWKVARILGKRLCPGKATCGKVRV